MTRRLKFITILGAGTGVTALGLGVGLGVGLHSSWTTNVEWYGNGSLLKEPSHFKNKNLIAIINTVLQYNKDNQTWLYQGKKANIGVVIDKNAYVILTPEKIYDQTGKLVSMPAIKNKDIQITLSFNAPVPPPNDEITYKLIIDGKTTVITNKEKLTYSQLFEKVGISADSKSNNWIKLNNDQITYYSILGLGTKYINISQKDEIISESWFSIKVSDVQVHHATMIFEDVETLPQSKTWTGDQTYETLFADALYSLGIKKIIVENGKWVWYPVPNDETSIMIGTIKFNDKDNGPEILASDKDQIAQDGTYYFDFKPYKN